MTHLYSQNNYAAVHVCLTQQGRESKPNKINTSLQNLGSPNIKAHCSNVIRNNVDFNWHHLMDTNLVIVVGKVVLVGINHLEHLIIGEVIQNMNVHVSHVFTQSRSSVYMILDVINDHNLVSDIPQLSNDVLLFLVDLLVDHKLDLLSWFIHPHRHLPCPRQSFHSE